METRRDSIDTPHETPRRYCEADAYWVRDDVYRDAARFEALSALLRQEDWPVDEFRGFAGR